MAHTPGPWDVTGVSPQNGNVTVGQRELRIVIADVTNAASFGDMLAGAMKRGGGQLRQSDASTQFANARLIAAAPDMLAALIRSEGMLNAFSALAEPEGSIHAVLADTRAAISRATANE